MNKELKILLDGYTYLTDKDGKAYTPREGFEADYNWITTDPEGYFAEYEDAIDKEAADNEREIYIDAGGGHDGAISLLRTSLSMLVGGTVEVMEVDNGVTQ